MPRRLLVCLLASVSVAMGQTISVQKLTEYVKSQVQLIKQKKGTDKELATALANIHLTDKLDASAIEDLQAAGAGPLTVKALEKLAAQSNGLQAAVLAKDTPYVPPPPPSSVEQARIIDAIREYVANYDSSIPDFICMEVEQREVAPSHTRNNSDQGFRLMDTITSKITYFQHEEKKEPILNGSRLVNSDYEKLGGATSRGDFETALRMLFDPATRTRFEWNRWATLRKHLTMVFDYHVSRDRSQYSIGISNPKNERITAYSGEVFVNAEPPYAVTRMTTKAEDIPVEFPLQRVESTLDYDYVDIGGITFLLPNAGEVLMDGPEGTSKNLNQFKFYRKYEVGSTITFDLNAPVTDPIQKEGAPIDCKDPKNKTAPQCKQ